MPAQDAEQKSEPKPEAKREFKPRQISFRMTEDEYQKVESLGAASKITAHDWCRQLVQHHLNNELGMTPTEKLLHLQMAHLRYMMGRVFTYLAKDEFTEKAWKGIRQELDENGVEIAEDVRQRYMAMIAAASGEMPLLNNSSTTWRRT